jgi:hypothetical protein
MRSFVSFVAALALAATLAAAGSGSTAPTPVRGILGAGFAHGAVVKPAKCLKYKKVHGKRICTKRAKPKPKPKPVPKPTPPPPAPTPTGPPAGAYSGVSAQNASLRFTVAGTQLTGLTFDELDATCTPGGDEFLLQVQLSGTVTLDTTGRGHAVVPVTTTAGDSGTVTFDVTIDTSGRATGSVALTITVAGAGGPYACSSGAIAWTGGTGAGAPAAPQHARQGHYVGTTAQGAAFVFDVKPSGPFLAMTDLTFPELDEDCDPGQIHLAFKEFHFSLLYVDARGNMRATLRFDDDASGFHEVFALAGAIDATGRASGTITDSWTFPSGGTTYTCGSGPVAWSATAQ